MTLGLQVLLEFQILLFVDAWRSLLWLYFFCHGNWGCILLICHY